MVAILSIVGRSNSGKTTLLEKLIAELTHQGLRVATIKHSHHQPDMDTPGKDSWRHKQAGAAATLLVGPERMLMVKDIDEALNPDILAERYFSDFDLLLVEGYAGMDGAKIEVVRSARSNDLRSSVEQGLIAVVTDVPGLKTTLPQFSFDDVFSLSVFIQDWMKAHG